MNHPLLTIKAVAEQTGLTPFVIRAWEKRYGVIRPNRTGTNRRRYTQEEADHLGLLARLTEAGHPIGAVANLPKASLEQMWSNRPAEEARPTAAGVDHMGACLQAVRAHDQTALESALARAEVALGMQGMLVRVAAPFAQTLGALWRDGTLSAAHEHFASAVLRSVLARSCRPFAANSAAPVLIVATPASQLHELGALLVAACASNLGWRVIYLGASLPAAEIAGAAIQHEARAVALSLVYPEDDPALNEELMTLRRLLPPSTAMLIGGRAKEAYRRTLEQIGAEQADDLAQLGTLLDRLRGLRGSPLSAPLQPASAAPKPL